MESDDRGAMIDLPPTGAENQDFGIIDGDERRGAERLWTEMRGYEMWYGVDGARAILKYPRPGERTGTSLQCGAPTRVGILVTVSAFKWRRPLIRSRRSDRHECHRVTSALEQAPARMPGNRCTQRWFFGRSRFWMGPGCRTHMWRWYGHPHTFPRFASSLWYIVHVFAFADQWGTTLDGFQRPGMSVRTFAGVLRVCVADALMYKGFLLLVLVCVHSGLSSARGVRMGKTC